ncbi:hypothetical protein D3C86_1828090 [compost metagenome]
MALRFNITQAGYSRIEKGSNRLSFEKLEEIAAVFEMDVRNIIKFDISHYVEPGFKKSKKALYCFIQYRCCKIRNAISCQYSNFQSWCRRTCEIAWCRTCKCCAHQRDCAHDYRNFFICIDFAK